LSLPVPVYRDRPQTLPDPENPGWVDLIAVHDAEHLRAKAEWRQTLAQSHPDAGGSDLRFRITQKAREKWLKAETEWYAKRGLTLPEPYRATPVLKAQTESRLFRTSMRRVGEYLAQHPRASNYDVGVALGIRTNTVSVNRSRIAKRAGAVSKVTQHEKLYRLLVDGNYHTSSECAASIGCAAVSIPVYVGRLRARGLDIESTRRPRRLSLYRLVGVAP
jgi:biotin operon repressor